MHYLTDGRRKYIWFPATNEEQFFDLEADRQELRNLAAERPDEVAQWRQRYRSWRNAGTASVTASGSAPHGWWGPES